MSGTRYILCIIVSLSIAEGIVAQVAVKSTVDRNRILIGEPITVSIDGYFPLGVIVNWELPDTIPHFEILELGKPDTIESLDGKKMMQVIKITSFDSGQWELPPFQMIVDRKPYFSDSLMIDVAYIAFDAEADYRDIKDIVDVADKKLGAIPWIIGLSTLLSIAVVAYFLSRKKQKTIVVQQPVARRAPYEEAMHALQELKKMGWPSNGEVKAYYTSLNDILREFLFRKLSISMLEKTNEELLRELQSIGIPGDSYTRIAASLRMSDFVKFAKYKPGDADNQNNFTIIESAIRIVNNLS